jgi:hypothetical protein
MFDLAKVKKKFSEFICNSSVPPIVKDGNDYYVFQHFTIKNGNGRYELYYKDDYIDTVQSSAAAISWCRAKQAGNFVLAQNIVRADQRVATKALDVELRKHRYKNTKDKEIKDTMLILVNEDIYRLKQAKNNLKKLIKQTKYIKIKGFDNELN